MRKLAALGLGASLTLVGPPDGKLLLYNGSAVKHAADARPTATYTFGFADHSARTLVLDLYAPPLDQARRLLVALASGLAALLAGMVILMGDASLACRPATPPEHAGRRDRRRRPDRDPHELTDPRGRQRRCGG